jgi:hypothetical protein
MYDLLKTGAAIFCLVIAFLIGMLIVKSEKENEKNK